MKKVLSLMLSLSLLWGLSISVSAASNTLKNFEKTETYAGQFADVAQSYWAATAIQTCYEYGLMQGYDADSFVPKGNLTVAQAIVMADRVHEIYTTGQSTLANGSPWYQPYVDYAVENGIIQKGDFSDFNAQVTRAQMAYIFCNALPGNALPAINFIQAVPDVSSSDPYQKDILTLYQAGVLTGSDIYGTFKPNDNIIRAEAAAIIARMAISGQRQSVTLLEDYVWNNVTVAVPEDVQQANNDGMLNLVSGSTNTAVVFYSQQDESYRGVDLKAMSMRAFGDRVDSVLTAIGIKQNVMSYSRVDFGSDAACLVVGEIVVNGQVMNLVMCIHIVDDTMTVVAFLGDAANDNSGAVLLKMANSLRISGSNISPQLTTLEI